MSSSAHVVLVPWLLRWPPARERTTLAAGLHAGSCLGIGLAVLQTGRPALRTVLLAGATSLPAAAAGLLAADVVERRLGRPRQLAALLALAGAGLAAADRRPQARDVGPQEAAWAALAQVAALAPGVSRSGAALTALRAAGVRRPAAERFSLLMSLPVTAGAAGLTLVRADRAALRALALPLGVGAPAAALAGWAAAHLLARRGGQALVMSSAYRLALALVVAVVARARDQDPRAEEYW